MLLDSGRSWAIRGHDLQPWQREESRSVRTARVGLLLSEERLRFLHLSAARTRRLAWRLHHGPAEASLYVSPDGPKCRTQSSSCPAGGGQQRRGRRGGLGQGAEMGRLATYRDDGNFFWRDLDRADRRKRCWNSGISCIRARGAELEPGAGRSPEARSAAGPHSCFYRPGTKRLQHRAQHDAGTRTGKEGRSQSGKGLSSVRDHGTRRPLGIRYTQGWHRHLGARRHCFPECNNATLALSMPTSNFSMTAPDGTTIACYSWLPPGPPKAVVQIAHGLAEHAGRYERLAQALNAHGYIVYANDHRGHARTASSKRELRWFAQRDGWSTRVGDLYELNRKIAAQHPGLSVVLLGHSMGATLALQFISRHGDSLAGVALSGASGQPTAFAAVGKLIPPMGRIRVGAQGHTALLPSLTCRALH